MTSRFTELAVDCADPDALAAFWCAVLGYEVQDADDELVTIGPGSPTTKSTGTGPTAPVLTFARVPEPKTVKNRLHLDLSPTDRSQSDEVRRLLALGARPVDVGQDQDGRQGQDGENSGPAVTWVVLADPEGNEFCVLATRRP